MSRIKFPITRNVVVMGTEHEFSLEKDEEVKCFRCGAKFKANYNTVYEKNGFTYLACPECEYKCNALYFLHPNRRGNG